MDKKDKKLHKEFTKFQHEHKDLLMPYFNALGLKGDDAFNRYNEIYRRESEYFKNDISYYILYGLTISTGQLFLESLFKKNKNNPRRSSFFKSIRTETQWFFHLSAYHTQEEIIEKSLKYKKDKTISPF